MNGETPRRITGDDFNAGCCLSPIWLDRNNIIFINRPNVEADETKVGIINVGSGQVKWLQGLPDVIAIGYGVKGSVDFARHKGEGIISIGTYDLKKETISNEKIVSGVGILNFGRMYRWPDSSHLLIKRESDNEDHSIVIVKDATGEDVTCSRLSEKWLRLRFNTSRCVVYDIVPGQNNSYASVVHYIGDFTTRVFYSNSSGKSTLVCEAEAFDPNVSCDGKYLVWYEGLPISDQDNDYWVWVCPIKAVAKSIRLCKGIDPAWRPLK